MNEQTRPADRPLKTIRTETLPEGALFVSPGDVLYQVVMAGSAGFRKAEPWPWPPHVWVGSAERPRAVALVPGSLLARNYPVVAEGRPLPTVSQSDFLALDDRPNHYIFSNEQQAKLAAQLDETLSPQSGLAARKERLRWILSDGQIIFRVYHYQHNSLGEEVDLDIRFAEENIKALPCLQGPYYWRYIPGWEEPLDMSIQDSHPSMESAIEAVVAEMAESIPKAIAPSEPQVAATERVTPVKPSTVAPEEELKEQPAVPVPSEPEAGAMPADEVTTEPEPKTPKKKRATRPRASSKRKPQAAKEPSRAPSRKSAKKPSRKGRGPTMIISVDIGYGYTKGVGPDGLRFSFPSVVGTAEEIRFATDLINGEEERAVEYGDWRFFYGKQALLQSRIQSAIFDRSRVHDHTYKMLFVAALVEMVKVAPSSKRAKVVTGLPVEFFSDRPEVVESFEGAYNITTDRTIKFAVDSVFVAPQPFGSLFRELLNEQGKIVSDTIEGGRVGVIDVGTYTTDFVVSHELRYVQRLSGSIRIGWSEVISQVQQALADLYRLALMPHEVDQALRAGEVRVRGESVSLEKLIKPAVTDIETAVVARARDLWGEGADMDMILVSGGGGPHLYDAIHDVYPHARLLDDAFWANAEGFYRFGQRSATFAG